MASTGTDSPDEAEFPAKRGVGSIEQARIWLAERGIEDIECITPDLAGVARGKMMPSTKFLSTSALALPSSIFMQTISGSYPEESDTFHYPPHDGDLRLIPDLSTLSSVPWETDPTARSLTILAAIEKGEGAADDIVKGWLARAVNAPRGPQWVCDKCHNIHGEWVPVCGNCGALDSLSWTAPSSDDTGGPVSVDMLPMIVGAPEPMTGEIVLSDSVGSGDTEEEIDEETVANEPTK